jgi:hypothetical protein
MIRGVRSNCDGWANQTRGSPCEGGRRFIPGTIKNPYQIAGKKIKKQPATSISCPNFSYRFFTSLAAMPCAMNKPSTPARFVDLNRARRLECGDAGTQPEWGDAETRGFLERPYYSTPLAKVLRVMLITAMVVAAVKVAWILVLHA